MYREPIFLQPTYHERIWGGNKLKTLFDYEIPNKQTGEAWAISAHQNSSSQILNGPLKQKSLKFAWENHPELFGKNDANDDFPLLVKILDAKQNLSVQVHPDDTYAQSVEKKPYGKAECWYVLDAEPKAEIILGHHARSKKEFKQLVESGNWDALLKRKQVKKGDFISIPSGTIHAIGRGIVVLETQQNSDITYRVYDYDRKDEDGNVRKLHIPSSIEVTNCPHVEIHQEKTSLLKDDMMINRLLKAKQFTVYHCLLEGNFKTSLKEDFLLVSVIEGNGRIKISQREFDLHKGDHFILPVEISHYQLTGDLELIISHE